MNSAETLASGYQRVRVISYMCSLEIFRHLLSMTASVGWIECGVCGAIGQQFL